MASTSRASSCRTSRATSSASTDGGNEGDRHRTSVEEACHAEQERQRQEREAVRSPQGQGHVEGARREDLQLPGRVESWRQEERLGLEPEAGRDDGTEE